VYSRSAYSGGSIRDALGTGERRGETADFEAIKHRSTKENEIFRGAFFFDIAPVEKKGEDSQRGDINVIREKTQEEKR